MTATAVRPQIRFARFILRSDVASRRYNYTFWNPKSLNGKGPLKPGATAEDAKKYAEVVARNNGEKTIKFRARANMGPGAEQVVYITDDPVIAAHVRSEIRSGRLRAREDVTMAPLSCPWCDFVLSSSTPKDQEAMYVHHLDNHREKLDERVGQVIDAPAVA